MANDGGTPRRFAERFRDDPVLAEFVAPLPRLTEVGERDLDESLRRLADALAGSTIRARVQIVLQEDEGQVARSWLVGLGAEECSVNTEPAERPDLEVLMREDIWWRLMEGSVSPLEAFGTGGLRVRGDLRLARDVIRQLQGRSGRWES